MKFIITTSYKNEYDDVIKWSKSIAGLPINDAYKWVLVHKIYTYANIQQILKL